MAAEQASSNVLRRGGKYCVAGGPGKVSCQNTSYTEGISMHRFPSNEATNVKWVRFVRKHRPNFKPSKTSALCSAHFEPTSYVRRQDISLQEKNPELQANIPVLKRLEKDAIPTIDSVVPREVPTQTPRERRQVLRNAQLPGEVLPYLSASSPTSVSTGSATPCTSSSQNINDAENGDLYATTTPSTPVVISSVECDKCSRVTNKLRSTQKENSRLRLRISRMKSVMSSMKYSSDDSSESESEGNKDDHSAHDHNDGFSERSEEEEEEDMETEDIDWTGLEEDCTDSEEETKEEPNKKTVTVNPNTKQHDEPKFIVFYSMLLSLFSMFCFNCRKGKPAVTFTRNGTMVVVTQKCKDCKQAFQWNSQPLVFGKYPMGNILLSHAILMAGASVSRVLLVLRHFGVAVYTIRTYFAHQKKFLFPTVLHYWESYTSSLVNSIKSVQDNYWSGDGRFDSMGHSAKFGLYTMFNCNISKVVHFQLLQANEVGSSQAMELEGAKRSFEFLTNLGLMIRYFISDRHRGIAKWVRECQPNTKHFYDIWHIARSIAKKMLKSSKEKGFEAIKYWMKGVRNHIYWCATTTKLGFEDMILSKWKSFMRHVSNKHTDHPKELFKSCAHETLHPRKWLKVGSKPYDKLGEILLNSQILNDLKKMSPEAQTSCLEGFHSTLNYWHPKMICFSWLGTYCRTILASLHFNENLQRETKLTKDGRPYTTVTYPKFKLGEEVVREVGIPPTYVYVAKITELLFSLSSTTRLEILEKYKQQEPEPLTHMFKDRVGRQEAIGRHTQRKMLRTELFPSAEEQNVLERLQPETSSEPTSSNNRKTRTCKKCSQPMKGHPRSHCPVNTESLNVVSEATDSTV